MIDEGEEVATSHRTVAFDNSVAGKFRRFGLMPELRLLDAGNNDVVTGEEVVKLHE